MDIERVLYTFDSQLRELGLSEETGAYLVQINIEGKSYIKCCGDLNNLTMQGMLCENTKGTNFIEFMKREIAIANVSESTKVLHMDTHRQLMGYSSCIDIRSVNSDFLLNLEGYMRIERELSINTIARHMKVIKRCMCDPGDEVLIPQPSYVSYLPCAVMADAKPVIIELKEENEFKLTKEELLASITDKTKVLVMPFPNNPTGAVMTREELEELVPVIIEKDIFVISDEIYSALTYNGEHCSIGSLPGMKERTIVINGFSKAFAMTGWRLGYACGPKEIISQMTKLHQYAIMCAPTNSQFAAVEALKNCDMEVEKMVTAYDQRRRYLMHAFKEMGIDCFEPFGA